MVDRGHKILTINTIHSMGEGSYTFIGEMHGYQLIFEQWDNGPIELNKDELEGSFGVNIQTLPQKFFDDIIKLALPEIEAAKYHTNLVNSFSEN